MIEFGELDAAEPAAAAEDEDMLNEAATESAGQLTASATAVAHQDRDPDSSEGGSDDLLQTLDNITKAVEDASSPFAEETANAASSPPHSSTASASNHSAAQPIGEVLAEQDPEFAFDGPSDPFAEEFASEETVADPFPAEQLAAARLAAAAAMQSDVDLLEDLDEDADELIAGPHPLGETTEDQFPGGTDEKGESSVPASAVHETAAAGEQESVQDQARISRHPKVTVTFDKTTGHSTFTIGSGKQLPSTTNSVAVPGGEPADRAQPLAGGKSSAVNSDGDLQDDRDMIVGIDDVDSPLRVAAETQPDQVRKARAHRAEYQTLFSRMRNG